MGKINAIITGVGGYVPDYILDNEELSRMVDTSDEWITTRVGIKERRILKEEGLGTSYLARKAAKQLIQKTGVDPDTIDALIVATTTPDYKFPSTASIVLGKLGLNNAFAYDLEAACCGFMYALSTACSFVESGRCRKVVVIGADKMSSIVDYQDRQTCVLFGDGAAAVLVEASEDGELGMQDMFFRTDTIDALIVATTTPDYKFPSTASIVLGKLGLNNAFAYDLEAACCGFMYALSTACSFVESGRCRKVVVIGADKMSSIVDYQDRQTCVLFGDGAAAVLVEASEDGELGMQDMFFRTDGKGLPFLHMKAGGSVCPPSHFTVDHHLHYLYQEGRSVFRYAVTDMSNDVLEIMKRNGLSAGDVDWVIPHEANLRIIEAVTKRAELPMDKVAINIQHYGNTSAATIPLALWDYESKLKKGDNVIFTAFGAGFVHGASFCKWAYDGAEAVTRK